MDRNTKLYLQCCLIAGALLLLTAASSLGGAKLFTRQSYIEFVSVVLAGWAIITVNFVPHYLSERDKNQKESEKQNILLANQKSLQNELTTELTNYLKSQSLSEKKVSGVLSSLIKLKEKTSLKKLQEKIKTPHQLITIGEKVDGDLILISLALHILKMKPIKFTGRSDYNPSQVDVLFFTNVKDKDILSVIDNANLYLWRVLKSSDVFGDNLGPQKFLCRLLKDNKIFLEDSGISETIISRLSTALENFDARINPSPRSRIAAAQEGEVPNLSPKHSIKIREVTPILQESTYSIPTSVSTSTLNTVSSVSSLTNFIPIEINADETVVEIQQSLVASGIRMQDITLENQGKKIELRVNGQLPELFRKILFKNLGKNLNMDEAISYNPTTINNIFSATFQEYKTTNEYSRWQENFWREERRIRAEPSLEKIFLRFALSEWRRFSNQEIENEKQQKLVTTLENITRVHDQQKEQNYFTEWKDFALQNYQEFVDFLNGAEYLRNFAKLGNVRLKGSYLYGDLLALNPVKAKDIDLEIFIQDLFSEEKTPVQIKELIESNLGFKIGEEIRISKKYSYAQYEFINSTGQKVDLSFYDSNKLPINDWVYGIDALRMDLTSILKLDQLISSDNLLSTKPSLGNGFMVQYPQTKVDSVLSVINIGFQLVNYRARDLLFNTIKRIQKGILTTEQVHSLYKNNTDFKLALDLDLEWLLNIDNAEILQKKCQNIGIDIEGFNQVVEEIKFGKTLDSKTPTAKTSLSVVRPLQENAASLVID